MLQNLKRDLKKIREELMACRRNTMPAKEFGATLLMAVVGLHVTEARIRKTQNLDERRRLINEFNTRRRTVEKAIRLLRGSSQGERRGSECGLRRAMP